ncbi:acyl-CoA synthetase [Variovorax sp. J22R133]|uniref:LpxL/LpxP family acyltransferase n=1 Tax=Variovorax brevis TaxID=3053503 RepID=UPI002576A111|nr:acyl-CoA synthetase [Variovorax sp. J22R133]MDM0112398.1 acyl-CoA synthetase [Variovorax sp. J22R133]
MSRLPIDSRHASDTQASQGDWAHTPERSNMLALRFVCWLALTFGRRVTRLVLHPITLYFFLFSPGPRRHIKRYLTRAIGPQMGWRDGYRLIHAFSSTVLDRVYFLRGRMDLFDFQVKGVEHTDAEAMAGRGAFLVGAHMGSFEAIGACKHTSAHPAQLKLAMLMYPDNAQQINSILGAISDPEFRPRIIALGRPNSMLALRDWMDSGGLAGLLVDRTLPRQEDAPGQQRGNSVSIDFLGHPASFNDSPFRLAALLRRKMFFMVGLYLGGARYEIRFEPLADFSITEGAHREPQIRQALEAYVKRLEALCREHPYNWFNFHDFWLEDAR